MLIEISVKTNSKNTLVDITESVREAVRKSGLRNGICHLASEKFQKAFNKAKEKSTRSSLRQEVIYGLFQISQRDPGDLSSQYALAEIYLNEGKLEESCEILSQIARREGEVERVVETLKKILSLDPSNGKVLFLIGNLLLRKGDREESLQFLESALKARGGESFLDQIILALRKASESQLPKTYLSLARSLMKKGEMKEAVEWVERLLKMRNGWMEEGMDTLREILSQVHVPEGALLLGKMNLERGDVKAAGEVFSLGLSSTNRPEIQMDLLLFSSKTLAKLGFKEESQKRYESAFSVFRDRKEVYRRIYKMAQWEKEVEIRKIDNDLKEIEESPSNNTSLLQRLYQRKIELYREMGEVEQAMEELNQFGQRFVERGIPNSTIRVSYLKELALCHLKKGDLLRASEILREIPLPDSPLTPLEKEILDLQARCFEGMAEWILALASLKRIHEEEPDNRVISKRIERLSTLLTLERLETRPKVLMGITSTMPSLVE